MEGYVWFFQLLWYNLRINRYGSLCFLHFLDILPSLPFVLSGVWVTLRFTLCSLAIGLPLAVFLAFLKVVKLKPLNIVANVYTQIFRGTPLIVQLGLVFYATPQLTGYVISPFEAGLFTFSCNSAAYASEIIRAGIQNLDPGQWEAGRVLGLTYAQTFRHIIFPQAIRAILPALVNEMIDLLKESAIVSTIGEMDLFRRAQIIGAEKFLYFEPLLLVACLYFAMVSLLNLFAKMLEKKYA